MVILPEVSLNTGYQMPLVGFGTATYPFAESETVKQAILCGIKNGYRHFDTASLYQTEQALGEAVAEALRIGLIKSRDELFITSKLWCSDCHQDRVLPALKKTLQNLQLDYLDLYLVHWPMSSIPGKYDIPKPEELHPMEFQSVWEKMEESQMLGLTKSIGVSNFSIKKIEQLLVNAKVIPAVVQVEMNPMWQQRKLIEFCKTTDIVVTGYSPLGGADGIMNNELLREIVVAKGKTLSQVCLRWLYEQGVTFVVKSFNEERMKENLRIFDWELSEEERKQISQLPQRKRATGEEFVSAQAGPFKSINELWDGEI